MSFQIVSRSRLHLLHQLCPILTLCFSRLCPYQDYVFLDCVPFWLMYFYIESQSRLRHSRLSPTWLMYFYIESQSRLRHSILSPILTYVFLDCVPNQITSFQIVSHSGKCMYFYIVSQSRLCPSRSCPILANVFLDCASIQITYFYNLSHSGLCLIRL